MSLIVRWRWCSCLLGLLCLLDCSSPVTADAIQAAINLRQPLAASTNLLKGNISLRLVLRQGELAEDLASKACDHLQTAGSGGGCSVSERDDLVKSLQRLTAKFDENNVGGKVMHQLHFGWELLLKHRSENEARLQFAHLVKAFPASGFLFQELAAFYALTAATGGFSSSDLEPIVFAPDLTWAHRTAPELENDLVEALEGWESYAAVRFRLPRRPLEEEEPELLAAGMPAHGFAPSGERRPDDGTATFLGLTHHHRLRHDLEVIRLLRGHGLLPEDIAAVAEETLSSVLETAERTSEGLLRPTEEQWRKLYSFHNRRLYVHPSPRLLGPAVNAEAQVAVVHSGTASESRAGSSLAGGGVLVLDNVLTAEALAGLRDFAELSTVWYQERPSYLGASLSSGFATPLLAQIAQELRAMMPELLCDLPLSSVWAFKFDDELQTGINVHADAAAVNVNLWITPDEENSDSLTGGLTIFDAAVDPHGSHSFNDYNSVAGSALGDLLRESEHRNVTVLYRQNRAVVFDSSRLHASQPLAFHKGRGVRSRRINVTFLFGPRGAYCPLRREVQLVRKLPLEAAEEQPVTFAAYLDPWQ